MPGTRLTQIERLAVERKATVRKALWDRGLRISDLIGRQGVRKWELYQTLSGTRDIPRAIAVYRKTLGSEFDRIWFGAPPTARSA
jgi:hypothetical protein